MKPKPMTPEERAILALERLIARCLRAGWKTGSYGELYVAHLALAEYRDSKRPAPKKPKARRKR